MPRRQVVRPARKPLIVMSPKSLLRHKLAVSTLEELAQGQFQTVIPEIDQLDNNQVTRLVLCGGKVYYDLLENVVNWVSTMWRLCVSSSFIHYLKHVF